MSELAARLLRGDRSAVPEALNLVDDTREARRAEACRSAMERPRGGAPRRRRKALRGGVCGLKFL